MLKTMQLSQKVFFSLISYIKCLYKGICTWKWLTNLLPSTPSGQTKVCLRVQTYVQITRQVRKLHLKIFFKMKPDMRHLKWLMNLTGYKYHHIYHVRIFKSYRYLNLKTPIYKTLHTIAHRITVRELYKQLCINNLKSKKVERITSLCESLFM